ncbi:MAG: hypothetical protein ABEJ89_09430 [Haloarculaceae archaeon]
MSDSQAYEEITVASDGVTVTKRYEADEFPVPAIAFNFASERSEPVSVTLTDEVPEGVAVEDLGFHPEYGSEYWTIDDDRITFEREIEPDTEYTTVYGIRATGTDNVEQFLTEPTLAEVDPPLEDDEGALVGEGSDAVRDVISGDSDSVPGLEDDGDEEIETLDLKDPNGDGTNPASTGEGRTEGGDDGSAEDSDDGSAEDGDDGSAGETSVAVSGDSLITAMANELRQNDVSKDDVQLLRRAFDLASEDGSVVARVDKLQSDVSEVIAYADALEEFLDENGTGQQMLEEFQSEIDEFRTRAESFQEELESVQSTVEQNDEELTEVSSTVEAVDEQLDGVEAEVEDLQDELDDRIADLETEVEDVREEIGDGDVDERLSAIESEIEELNEWREQLSSVIGGGN